MRTAPEPHTFPTHPSGAVSASDFAYALARLRRMTPLEWVNGIASVAIIVGWTLFAVSL